jgi:hypothetical protein
LRKWFGKPGDKRGFGYSRNKEMEGFSDDFNWNTLKTNSEEAELALYVSEQKRIESVVREAIKLNWMQVSFEISSKLNLFKRRVLLEQLCTRFPERVFTADLDGKWKYDPKKPDSYGSVFVINLQ